MDPESAAIIVAYFCALTAGIFFSFKARKGFLRVFACIVTGLLVTPILLILVAVVIFWEAQPPSLAQLQRDFPAKRSDLETILRMSDEDPTFWRIAPGFLDRVTDGTSGYGRYTFGNPEAGLPEPRWNAYRAIYKRNGIKLGVERDTSGDAFIMVDSIGLLNRGHTSGYLFCAQTTAAESDRFEPCLLHQDKGERSFNSNPRQEGYSFQRLDGRWYAFDQGPS